MKCVINNYGIKSFAQAINSSCKFGEDIYIDATPTEFVIKVFDEVNRSVFFCTSFYSQFFWEYQANGRVGCKLKSRSCLLAFKKEKTLARNLDTCSMEFDEDHDSAIFTFIYKSKMTKTIKLPFIYKNVNWPDDFDKRCQNHIVCKTQLLQDCFNQFHKDVELITMKVKKDCVKFQTHIDEADQGDYRTQCLVQSDEFSHYNIKDDINVTFSVKLIKPFLLFANTRLSDIDIYLEASNKPLCFMSQQPPHLKVTMALSPIEILDYPLYPSPNQENSNAPENDNESELENEKSKQVKNDDQESDAIDDDDDDDNDNDNDIDDVHNENIDDNAKDNNDNDNDEIMIVNNNNNKESNQEKVQKVILTDEIELENDEDIDFGSDENLNDYSVEKQIKLYKKKSETSQNDENDTQINPSQSTSSSIFKNVNNFEQIRPSISDINSQTKQTSFTLFKSRSFAENFDSSSINLTKRSKNFESTQLQFSLNKTSQESSFGEEMTIEDEALLEDDGDEILVGATDDELEDSQS